MPNMAPASMAMPRASPSFSVATPSLLARLFDRGLVGTEIAEHGGQPLMDGEQPARQRQVRIGLNRTAADEGQPVALALDHAPAGAAEPGGVADDPDGSRMGGMVKWRRSNET